MSVSNKKNTTTMLAEKIPSRHFHEITVRKRIAQCMAIA